MSRFTIGVMGVLLVFGTACGGANMKRQPVPDPLAGESANSLLERGYASLRSGDSVRAEQYLAEAIARGADERKTMPLVLRACLIGSRMSAALKHALPYLRKNPEDWSLRYVVATIYESLGQPEDAIHHLVQVREQAPEQALPAYSLATIYREYLQDFAKAEPEFRTYLKLDPNGKYAAEVRFILRRNSDAGPVRTLVGKSEGEEERSAAEINAP